MDNQFGKLSQLHLTAELRDGKTILSDKSFTAPFKIMFPFYEKEDFMTVMLLTASAGIMAGDRQEFDFLVRTGAKMEFVSQAYEKIHKMDEGRHAERVAHIRVESGAWLHYTPLPTIPFTGSDFRNTVDIDLSDETSHLVYSEVLTCGRVAHGEEFGYRRFSNRVSIYQGGEIIYLDNTLYEPETMDMRGFGMYEGFTHLANLVLCNEPRDDEWILKVRELLEEEEEIEGGVTRTDAGNIVVRIFGMTGQKLTDLMELILTL